MPMPMKNLTRIALIALVAGTTLACEVVIADDCDQRAPRSAEIDAAGAARLVVDAGAGSLEIRGVPDASRVSATGEACASTVADLAEVDIEIKRSGDTITVTALYPEGRYRGSAALDLAIEAPAGLDLVVDDGSGSLEIASFASVVVDDGSGELDIRDITGSVTVDDGSGGLRILGVDGDVRIDDGSGEIEVTGVGGEVRIKDGSGGIELRNVGGVILDDGSGGIDVAGVTRDVVVEEDGSGSIKIRDVGGDVTVERDGSGGIDVEGVRGRVTLPPD